MSQRQLKLVSANSNCESKNSSLSSVRPRMLQASLPTPSPPYVSPFVRKLQQLEAASPAHAAVLGELADQMMRKITLGDLPPLE